jgi:hypothetical protein
MGKLLGYRVYIVVVAICILLGITFLIRSCMYGKEVRAVVSPLDIEQGLPVEFADSTQGAHKWFWEFGNGDTFSKRRGKYIFPETGKYQIRLTVNGNQEKRFIINVRPPKKDKASELVKIIAPDEAFQGEYITFRGEGPSKDWRWEFGETGRVDAFEKNAIYKYELPGRYVVALRTEETKYPVLHTIDIIPQYSESDSTDVASIIGNDIKERLQAIVDQKPFNKNYNYIMDTYLCRNPNTLVIVNNDKKNDFYSYCQGLRIIGRKKVRVENVLIDVDENGICVNKLIVVQTDLE